MRAAESVSRRDRPWLALAWMTLAAMGFSAMSLSIKLLSGRVELGVMIFLRSALNLVVVVGGIYLWFFWSFKKGRRLPEFFPRAHIPLLIGRGLAGLGGLTCLFYAISVLPLTIASLLGWCSPIFTILFSALFSGERLARRQAAWILVAFTGLFAVVQLPRDWSGMHQAIAPLGVAVGILGAMFGGLAYTAVRAATRVVDANVIVVYFVGVATVLSAPWAAVQWRALTVPDALLLLGGGLGATMGQVAMTQAYRHAKAGVVSSMNLLTAVGTLLLAWAVLGEALEAGQWAGIIVVMFAILQLSVR